MSHRLQFSLAVLFTAILASAIPAQPGSYSKQSTTSEGVIAAAKFAVETQSKKTPVTLIKILSAESQVVAGRNTRMTLEVRTKNGSQQVVAVVWDKLDGTKELTNWDVKGGGSPEKKTENEQIDGGYSKIATADQGVVASAKFAVAAHFQKEPATLVKILSAETQIVAGRNFRMTLEVRTKNGNRQAVAVVWNKLDGTKELTYWQFK